MMQIGKKIMYRDEVCTLIDIAKKYRDDEDYLVFESEDEPPVTTRVPMAKATVCVRPLITREELKDLVAKIPDIPVVEVGKYTKGEEYKQLLKSGRHEDTISVIKTTYLRQQARIKLSYKPNESDKTYFRQAEKRFYTEVAYALGLTVEEAKQFIIDKVNESKGVMYQD